MILTCPECATRYVVNAAHLRPSGRMVRCAKCSHTWFEDAPPPDPAEADLTPPPAPEPSPEQPAEAPATAEPAWRADERPRRGGPRTAARTNLPALPQEPRHGSPLGWLALVLFVAAVAGGVLAFPRSLVAAWPATAKLYDTLGMDPARMASLDPAEEAPPPLPPLEQRLLFKDLQPAQQFIDGVLTLSITGRVHNVGAVSEQVPPIKVVLVDGQGLDLKTWTLEPRHQRLAPGASTDFATQLANPPPEAQDIRVTFEQP